LAGKLPISHAFSNQPVLGLARVRDLDNCALRLFSVLNFVREQIVLHHDGSPMDSFESEFQHP
jgi:hypothetical protein